MNVTNGYDVMAAEGGGFHAPGPGSFELPPVFYVGDFGVTKPMLMLMLSAVIVVGFAYLSSRKAAMVPGRLQFAGEQVYGFVRNSLARENIDGKHFMMFVPYLFSLFLFILVNNYYGILPFFQFPSFSRIGFVLPLALVSWAIYIGAGMWKHGVLGYLKHQSVPPGITGPILILLVPLEFMSNILVRPVTLALRLFANMFAGHLLLILFALGGEYLLLHGATLVKPVGILAWLLFIAISFLELLIQFLQAYV
ncbi:MAG TPA: F0F1 ATP synthase subunit A, partial [Propionicimonas sp.]|nr:F0F1 ATP synthase subunit A [Propionicimonas sp.]